MKLNLRKMAENKKVYDDMDIPLSELKQKEKDELKKELMFIFLLIKCILIVALIFIIVALINGILRVV